MPILAKYRCSISLIPKIDSGAGRIALFVRVRVTGDISSLRGDLRNKTLLSPANAEAVFTNIGTYVNRDV